MRMAFSGFRMSLERFTTLFPLWTLLGSALALLEPALFTWFNGLWITLGLGLIMLGMGLDCRPSISCGWAPPRPALVGVIAQFAVMPGLAAAIAALPPAGAVGRWPDSGGVLSRRTASNVVAMIARADVALSVVMTSLSTLAAVVFTPRLAEWLASQYVPVDGWLLLWRVLQVVLLPVTCGVLLRQGLPSLARRVAPVMPPIAVAAIVMIVASVVGSQRQLLFEQGPLLLLACVLLHAGGFGLGFLLARLTGESAAAQRTISIEVGMQNSGLAVVLARSGGFASPLTALPGAISAVVHCLIGSGLAACWRRRSS